MCGSFHFLNFLYSPPVNRPKDPWPRVLSLPGAQGGFVGGPTSLARDNILYYKLLLWEGMRYTLLIVVRDGPLMIWGGGLRQRICVEFFPRPTG